MTLLASWIGVDTHGIASTYIAADSRITWGDGSHFDHGRKVFAFRNSPDILGYCGDVLFPSMVLSRLNEMADCGLLFSPNASCKDRSDAIEEAIVCQFSKYPSMVESITAKVLQVLHISRDMYSVGPFTCEIFQWTRDDGWSRQNVAMPKESGRLCVLGSGAKEFEGNFSRYSVGPSARTSRNVFHCFCDTLFNIKDKCCGGAPQLVGIYRKSGSPAISYGIITRGQRYYLGGEVGNDLDFSLVEWRNDLFEICDGRTMEKHPFEQSQPDSLRR